ncbi:hypothetical protein GIB67_020293 [Kingdonia uniflora]|uniref:Uncharacterized protein n=1 Tax=Kingdonia uniflora TaxID=39325 RepID=A0A7J7P3V0_9MAGN|nr:hypothetical protein GIB67_020293 [Kingdonia uniflora]
MVFVEVIFDILDGSMFILFLVNLCEDYCEIRDFHVCWNPLSTWIHILGYIVNF